MFSGGDSTVATRLETLGFEVTRPVSLLDWSVDELMLALDLSLRTWGQIGDGTPDHGASQTSSEVPHFAANAAVLADPKTSSSSFDR